MVVILIGRHIAQIAKGYRRNRAKMVDRPAVAGTAAVCSIVTPPNPALHRLIVIGRAPVASLGGGPSEAGLDWLRERSRGHKSPVLCNASLYAG